MHQQVYGFLVHSCSTYFWVLDSNSVTLQILEYADDLEDYYAQGYGTKENAELSCSILDDLLTKIM